MDDLVSHCIDASLPITGLTDEAKRGVHANAGRSGKKGFAASLQTSPDRGPLFRWQVPESGDVEYQETGCESVIRLCGVVGVRRASPPLRFCGSGRLRGHRIRYLRIGRGRLLS